MEGSVRKEGRMENVKYIKRNKSETYIYKRFTEQ